MFVAFYVGLSFLSAMASHNSNLQGLAGERLKELIDRFNIEVPKVPEVPTPTVESYETEVDSEVSVQEVSVQEVSVNEVPAQEVPVNEVAVNEVPVQEVPVQEVPVNEVAAQEVPVQEVPVQEVPVNEVAAQEVPEELQPSSSPMVFFVTMSIVLFILILFGCMAFWYRTTVKQKAHPKTELERKQDALDSLAASYFQRNSIFTKQGMPGEVDGNQMNPIPLSEDLLFEFQVPQMPSQPLADGAVEMLGEDGVKKYHDLMNKIVRSGIKLFHRKGCIQTIQFHRIEWGDLQGYQDKETAKCRTNLSLTSVQTCYNNLLKEGLMEMKIVSMDKNAVLSIGLADKEFPIFRLPGTQVNSVGILSNDCSLAVGSEDWDIVSKRPDRKSYGKGNVVAIRWRMNEDQSINFVIYVDSSPMHKFRLRPAVAKKIHFCVGCCGSSSIEVNFGNRPFYNIYNC